MHGFKMLRLSMDKEKVMEIKLLHGAVTAMEQFTKTAVVPQI